MVTKVAQTHKIHTQLLILSGVVDALPTQAYWRVQELGEFFFAKPDFWLNIGIFMREGFVSEDGQQRGLD